MIAHPAWTAAASAAALLAVDPAGLGGIIVRASAGPVRDAYLRMLQAFVPGRPWRKVPAHITDARLLGGLDLGATLRAGRPVAEQGLLADADGGILIVPMAERLSAGTAARLAAVMDQGEVVVERDGLAFRRPARFGLVLLDEGGADDDPLADSLVDRTGFTVDLNGLRASDIATSVVGIDEIMAARDLLPDVVASEAVIAALVQAALVLGIPSLRTARFALRAACVAAALAGRTEVSEDDAAIAGQLVLALRARTLPADAEPEPDADPPPPPDPSETPPESESQAEDHDKPLADTVVDAATAVIPPGLLAALAEGPKPRRSRVEGKSGASKASQLRGRPLGARRGDPRTGARLDLIETLRAAAPWQGVRRRSGEARVAVRRDDFRVRRFKERSQTTTIFVVDASGSQALHRLAEAKGAVELLLAQCYVRRDQVALVAFRDRGAQVLLPPTRSLARAKRCLSGLPGGGGTPLAAGLDTARQLAELLRRRGDSVLVVLLTDGQANVTRAGQGGRAEASEDALAAARALRAQSVPAILVDTSPRPQARAERLAAEMHARYLALPSADARVLNGAVQAASRSLL